MKIMIPAWVDGVLTPVEKLEVHKRGLRHKAISVFILRGTEVLLQRRALEKYHTPGLWANSCCTHPAWEEPSDECAIRRLGEELGVEITDLDFRETLEYRADVGGGLTEYEVVDVFITQADSDLRISPNPEEVMDFEWVEYADLQKRITRYARCLYALVAYLHGRFCRNHFRCRLWNNVIYGLPVLPLQISATTG